MGKKLRVAWICHLSNEQIREKLVFNQWTPIGLIRRIMGKKSDFDFAQWNTNAISEFEKFDDVELHVIAPHSQITTTQEFQINGVIYHFIPSEEDTLSFKLRTKFLKRIKKTYTVSSKKIYGIISNVKPDIIHMIGAENPYYSESALYLPKDIPLIVSLQTLLNNPDFLANYPISKDVYDHKAGVEKQVLLRADYITVATSTLRNIIKTDIKPDVKFLDMNLAIGENVAITDCEKKYDFVYFAANISKAVDYAVEAFALAQKKCSQLTLLIVGDYEYSYKQQLDSFISEHCITGIHFTGKLETHDDVIKKIREAKFALLPLKVDMISSTIREAMANGLPVVTTVTPATPSLNNNRQSVLLSEKGDFKSMADNMCRLIKDDEFASLIKNNAVQTILERYDNAKAMRVWYNEYKKIVNERQ